MIISDMVARANGDPVVRQRANFVDLAFGLGVGPESWTIRINKGEVSATPTKPGDVAAFTLQAGEADWADFAKPVPPPGTHDILGLFEGGRLDITGQALPLMRNLMVVKAVLEKMREPETAK